MCLEANHLNILSKTEQLVGLGGFEPPTSPLSGVRSNQLSYRPITICVDTQYLIYYFTK